MSEENKCSKCVVSFRMYDDVVLDTKDAIALADIISRADIYKEKYTPSSAGLDASTSVHLYPMEEKSPISIRVLTKHHYHIAKMAGKPEDD